MAKTHIIDGIGLALINSNLGAGGQGRAELMALKTDPNVRLVLKHLPISPEMQKRVQYLTEQALPLISPYLAAPIAAKVSGSSEILHIAPFADGHDLESDVRTFPESMEVAFQFSCLTSLLEEMGLAHGDLAPANIMITPSGEVYLIDFDNFDCADPNVPPPPVGGWWNMIAPELRTQSNVRPNIKSDRFTYGIVYNFILLGRHPACDINIPAKVVESLTTGRWPERDRSLGLDDIPIQALGSKLPSLFDAAFSLDPDTRPSADDWRRAIGEALQNLVIHDCGEGFVYHANLQHCPFCGADISGQFQTSLSTLKINIPSLASRYSLELQRGQSVTLGRANLGGATASVSGRHLEIMRVGEKLVLRNVGRHPTLMLKDGRWYRLEETEVPLSDIQRAPLSLQLADLPIDIGT